MTILSGKLLLSLTQSVGGEVQDHTDVKQRSHPLKSFTHEAPVLTLRQVKLDRYFPRQNTEESGRGAEGDCAGDYNLTFKHNSNVFQKADWQHKTATGTFWKKVPIIALFMWLVVCGPELSCDSHPETVKKSRDTGIL